MQTVLACTPFSLFALVQPKCERYWCNELHKPFELPDRGFTVTMTGKKVYADYEIRDITIRCVSVHACTYVFVTQTSIILILFPLG